MPCLEENRILTMKNVLFLGRKNLFIPAWMKKGGGRKGLYLPEGRTHCPQFVEKMEVTASPTLSPGLVWVLLSQPGCPRAPWKDLRLAVRGRAPLCWACFLHNLLESQLSCVCDMGEGDTAPGKSELGRALGRLPCALEQRSTDGQTQPLPRERTNVQSSEPRDI